MGTERCNFCATTMEMKNLKRCGNCKIAFYCSKECQKSHWKIAHKAICMIQTAQPGQALIEHPDEKAQLKRLNRWINAWSTAMTECLSIALDMVNHQWGRHDTHTLSMTIEYTDLKEDTQLYKVAEASIKSNADVIKIFPQLDSVVPNPTGGLSDWPRLRCVILVKDRNDPTQMERARIHSCLAPNLREVFCALDKNYSQAIAKLAIPFLICEINGLKNPEETVRNLHLMIGGPEVIRPFLGMVNFGLTNDDDGELLQQYFEQLLPGRGEENDV